MPPEVPVVTGRSVPVVPRFQVQLSSATWQASSCYPESTDWDLVHRLHWQLATAAAFKSLLVVLVPPGPGRDYAAAAGCQCGWQLDLRRFQKIAGLSLRKVTVRILVKEPYSHCQGTSY
jgi:hypothetical protein